MAAQAVGIKTASSSVGSGAYVDESDIFVGMAGMDGVGFALDLDSPVSCYDMGGGYYPLCLLWYST